MNLGFVSIASGLALENPKCGLGVSPRVGTK